MLELVTGHNQTSESGSPHFARDVRICGCRVGYLSSSQSLSNTNHFQKRSFLDLLMDTPVNRPQHHRQWLFRVLLLMALSPVLAPYWPTAPVFCTSFGETRATHTPINEHVDDGRRPVTPLRRIGASPSNPLRLDQLSVNRFTRKRIMKLFVRML